VSLYRLVALLGFRLALEGLELLGLLGKLLLKSRELFLRADQSLLAIERAVCEAHLLPKIAFDSKSGHLRGCLIRLICLFFQVS